MEEGRHDPKLGMVVLFTLEGSNSEARVSRFLSFTSEVLVQRRVRMLEHVTKELLERIQWLEGKQGALQKDKLQGYYEMT